MAFFRCTTRIAVALIMCASGMIPLASPLVAQALTCTAEAEPNDTPETAPSLTGEVCLTGTVPTGDQDLALWAVTPLEALRTWTFTIVGAPTTITSIHVYVVTSQLGARVVAGPEVLRVDSSAESAAPGVASAVSLAAGRYLLGISRGKPVGGGEPPSHDYRVTIELGPELPPDGDVEPNDAAADGSPVSGAFELTGDLQGSPDAFRWTLSPDDAARQWDLEVRAHPVGVSLNVTLQDSAGVQLAAAVVERDGLASIRDLVLAAGTYVVLLHPGANGTLPYVLSGSIGTATNADAEPNDDPARALPLVPDAPPARGRIAAASDKDDYRFSVDPGLAQMQLEVGLRGAGDAARRVCISDAAGAALQCRGGQGRISLSNLLLPVGDYLVEVSGQPSLVDGYELYVARIGPVAVDRELEPNDGVPTATRFEPTVAMRGLANDVDDDFFRVATAGDPQLWRLDAEGSGISMLAWIDRSGRVLGSADVSADGARATLTDLFLVPGDHWIHLEATGGAYTLRLTPLGAPDPNAEREPNDGPLDAEPLPIDETRSGRLPGPADVDTFRFFLAAREHIAIELDPAADGAIAVDVSSSGLDIFRLDDPILGEAVRHEALMEPGDYELTLRPVTASESPYTLKIGREDPFSLDPGASGAPLPATLALTTSTTDVAAYWSVGQRVSGQLSITNTATTDLALTLDAVTSHYLWSVALAQPSVTVAAGATVTVPLTIVVQPDAWAGVPVRVSIRARAADGSQATASAAISPGRDTAPVDPAQTWALPAALLGGLDVASLALGGTAIASAAIDGGPVPPFSASSEALLHDGLSLSGTGYLGQVSDRPLVLTVDLAGDDPIPVAGVILDPLASDGVKANRPRDFELLLSGDGIAWDPALTGEMSPLLMEQAFALDTPVPARFAQLRVFTTHGGSPGAVALGEWKVIATPGAVPTIAPLNIADPIRGGHIVWMEPNAGGPAIADSLLDEDPARYAPYLSAGPPIRWVVGFRDDRAAQVVELQWVDVPGSDPATRFASVDVEVSSRTPLGPWTAIGNWPLDRRVDGSVAPFPLPAGTWARFIRFTGDGPATGSAYREFPATLRVMERATDDSYRSILGEWGGRSPSGIYELLVPPDPAASSDPALDDDTPETATPLASGETALGRVQRERDVDWFVLTIPDGQNTLTLDARGSPSVGVRLSLFDDAGWLVPMTVRQASDPALVVYDATVSPAATYRLKVEQPPVSLAVTYDTSASLMDRLPFIAGALRAFARDVVRGEEFVRVTPFEQTSLLDDWTDLAYVLENAVDGALRLSDSSSAETAMNTAIKELREREGTRALLVVTDAETSSYAEGTELWHWLETVQPTVFSVHVGGGNDPAITTHLMQDWAASAGGAYQYAASHGEIDRAFDRMATWLRRPAGYSLSWQTSHERLAPGSISVRSPDGAPVPIGSGAAVELVLDTSGSMLKGLDGRTRFDIAKEVLVRLVSDSLPERLPVALRTFKAGRKSCDTELTLPLGPLDRDAVIRAIEELPINKRTSTPIGGSLAAVRGDLGEVSGPRIVVLVTDGQETCGGDPESEVQSLVDAGFETTINIVGFALEDPALKEQMGSWAALGGGTFFDAQDQDSLLAGVAAALQAPFRVYDTHGTQVASGVVGGPAIELPGGRYRVDVLTDPLRTFEAVEVGPGQGVDLQLGAAPAP